MDDTTSNPQEARKREKLARSYLRWLRRRHRDATPEQLVAILERHYLSAVTGVGALVSAGQMAATVGVAMIPFSRSARNVTASSSRKSAARRLTGVLAVRGATAFATRGLQMLPAGDHQLQFELTALFASALAQIHGLELDQDQTNTLVYGLTGQQLSRDQIKALAVSLAKSPLQPQEVLRTPDPRDWMHWAESLATALPGGVAGDLLSIVDSQDLYPLAATMNPKQQARIGYGVAAAAGGAERLAFGKEVVATARRAFPPPPEEFPGDFDAQDGDAQDVEFEDVEVEDIDVVGDDTGTVKVRIRAAIEAAPADLESKAASSRFQKVKTRLRNGLRRKPAAQD